MEEPLFYPAGLWIRYPKERIKNDKKLYLRKLCLQIYMGRNKDKK